MNEEQEETAEVDPVADTERPKQDKVDDTPPERLAEFVIDWCEGRIMSSVHLEQAKQVSIIGMVFMPIALGAISNFSEEGIKDIGLIWERTDAPGQVGRAINGFPIFSSCRLMNKKDWDRARKAIIKEEDLRKKKKEEILAKMVDEMVEEAKDEP